MSGTRADIERLRVNAAAREAKRAANRAQQKPASGIPAKGMGSMSRNMSREKNRLESLSMYAAKILMPDEAGMAHARGVVAAGAQARYGRTEVEDAIFLMQSLGVMPTREDQDGSGQKI